MICQLCPEDMRQTTGKLSGTHATNAKKHLRFNHKDAFEAVEKADKAKATTHPIVSHKKRDAPDDQPKLSFVPAKKPRLAKSSEEYKVQSRNLAHLLACPTIPVSIVQRREFRRFVINYDRKYEIPRSSHGCNAVLDSEARSAESQVRKLLETALSRAALTLDIWTDGVSQAYLGVTSHFIDAKGRLEHCFLGVWAIDGSVTAERVRAEMDAVTAFYGLTDEKISALVTDNGSNIVKAWKSGGWPIFLEQDVRFLEQFCKLVQPFYEDLMGMQGDTYATSSRVYMRVKELLKHCDKFRDDQCGVAELAADIKRELVKRFGCFVDNRSPRFNAHFVIASLLDPSKAFMVDMDLPYLTGLLTERLNIGEEGRDVSDTESILEATEDESFEEMMLRKRKTEKRRSSQHLGASSQDIVSNECGRYLQSVMCDDMHAMRVVDPIRYWQNEGKAKYPTIAPSALDYLAVPATSAPVERCFSAAGLALDGKKSNTKAPLLNNKLMIHLNKHLFLIFLD